jgi:hypothetical protein
MMETGTSTEPMNGGGGSAEFDNEEDTDLYHLSSSS